MSSFLDLKHLSFRLPSGHAILSDLTFTFNQPISALVGGNGVGKSLLAQLMSGQLPPTSGQCLHTELTHYLAQAITTYPNETVADALGISPILSALQNIEAGSIDVNDFKVVGNHWDITREAEQILEKLALPSRNLTLLMSQLSGGEQMRIRIASAFLSNASILILDESSNHLDHHYKHQLWDMITEWQGQIILITHDRFLLRKVKHIVELSPQGLRSYLGSYDGFIEQKTHEEELALQNLANVKLEQKRRIASAQAQLEKQNKRAAQANKNRGSQNQAAILLDRQKNRSEKSLGKVKAEQANIMLEASDKIKSAAQKVLQAPKVVLYDYQLNHDSPQILARLDNVELPFVIEPLKVVNLQIEKGWRLALVGNNGMGKTLLLKAIEAHSLVPVAYIDQHLSSLDQNSTLLALISHHETEEKIAELRMQFAQLGFNSDLIKQPIHSLSGGEQLKATIALTLYKGELIQLLLLDEPNNHLDLDSLNALENMLRQYNGGLIVISHDTEFLENIGMTYYLEATLNGWINRLST